MATAQSGQWDTQLYHEGSLVWVPQDEAGAAAAAGGRRRAAGWVRGAVEALEPQPDGGHLLAVRIESGALLRAPAAACQPQNERDDGVEDLVRSDFLHEPGVLHTLAVRYGLDAIYTYSGSILIAANPHKRLRGLYGPRMMAQYRGAALGELSPHPYAIAEAAYGAMMVDAQRQAILISGESGAGKTESAKMVMQYLAHRVGGGAAARAATALGAAPPAAGAAGAAAAAPIEEQVLESNPLLEAFGNAKTARNDNSSRFGKWVEIDFDAAGRVTGASISTYLLERSRVTSIRAPERSFHIFYQLCAGADAARRAELELAGGARAFRYLAQSDTFELADTDDAVGLAATLEAMRVVGLGADAAGAVLRLVAGVLHLGNVEFAEDARDEAALAPGAGPTAALTAAARLLGVAPAALLDALTTRAIETRGERIVKRLSPVGAAESRDALAKALYARLFDALVAAVNRRIGAVGGSGRTPRSVGILDIYGFESFETNSFEQLCINLANEKLQQAFNTHVFKGEQAEYAAEGIDWSYVDFVDNQDVLDLLEGAGGAAGIFPLIDEACRLPRATDADLAHALRERLAARARFGAPRRDAGAFAVTHYAGEVVYAAAGMLDKNRDFVVAEHAALAAASALPLLRELFADAGAAPAGGAGAADGPASPRAQQPRSAFMLASVGGRFRRQLGGLMAALGECQPHFVRCVKPNPEGAPGALAPPYVLEQLRAGGVLEAVKIACAGFPTRKPLLPFAQRYALLLGARRLAELGLPLREGGFVEWRAAPEAAVRAAALKVLAGAGLEGWQLGRSRVFLRAGQLALLEAARGRLLAAAAVRIQAAWRGVDARRQRAAALAAAARLQAAWRGLLARREARALREERAAVRLQAAYRRHAACERFLALRRDRAATRLQAAWRRHAARSRFLVETEMGRRAAARAEAEAARSAAARRLQAVWRGVLGRRLAAAAAAEAARMRALQAERDSLAGEAAQLAAQLAAALARADRAEAALASAQAQSGALRSELDAARAAAAAATAGAATEAQREAGKRASGLEEAHRAATAALQAELAVAARQVRDAEARGAEAAAQLHEAEGRTAALRAELEAASAAAAEGAASAASRAAAAEAVAADAAARADEQAAAVAETLAAAGARVEAAQAEAAAAMSAARHDADCVAAEAGAEATRHAEGLAASAGRAERLAAQVAALTARLARLEAEARGAAAREASLLGELDAARQAAAAAPRPATPLLKQAATPPPAEGAAAPGAPDGSPAQLDDGQAAAVAACLAAAVAAPLPPIEAWAGAGAPPLRMPQAAWLLHRCLLHWARGWRPTQVGAAAARVEAAVVAAAAAGGLDAAGYWLGASLALGALLKMRSVGRPDLDALFRLSDRFIAFGDLHVELGAAVAAAVPVRVAALLSEEACRSARRFPAASPGGASPPLAAVGAAAGAWRELTGGADAALAALRARGAPAPAVRAAAWATLRYIDGELLNALLLRRECCSVSAARALQAGLAALVAWAGAGGGEWCCSADDAARALERAAQAAAYLAGGAEDCARKAARGVDVLPDLGRLCPALTLQQVSRLTEHAHDDWLAGAGGGREALALLGTLRQLMAEQRRRVAGAGAAAPAGAGSAATSPPAGREGAQAAWVAFSAGADEGAADKGEGEGEEEEEDEEEGLLVDSRAAFELSRSHHQLTRRLLTEAARSFVQAPAPAPAPATPGAPSPGGVTPATPVRTPPGAAAGAPGSAPRATPPPAPPSGLSLLDAIDDACRGAPLPGALDADPAFAFLKA
jgi:myosin-5